MVLRSSTVCNIHSTALQADLGVNLSSSPYWTMVFARKTKLKSHYNQHGQNECGIKGSAPLMEISTMIHSLVYSLGYCATVNARIIISINETKFLFILSFHF